MEAPFAGARKEDYSYSAQGARGNSVRPLGQCAGGRTRTRFSYFCLSISAAVSRIVGVILSPPSMRATSATRLALSSHATCVTVREDHAHDPRHRRRDEIGRAHV